MITEKTLHAIGLFSEDEITIFSEIYEEDWIPVRTSKNASLEMSVFTRDFRVLERTQEIWRGSRIAEAVKEYCKLL